MVEVAIPVVALAQADQVVVAMEERKRLALVDRLILAAAVEVLLVEVLIQAAQAVLAS